MRGLTWDKGINIRSGRPDLRLGGRLNRKLTPDFGTEMTDLGSEV